MIPSKPKLGLLASSISLGLMACGGGQPSPSAFVSPQAGDAATVSRIAAAAPPEASAQAGSRSQALAVRDPRPITPAPAPVIDALTLTDPSSPLLFDVGDRT